MGRQASCIKQASYDLSSSTWSFGKTGKGPIRVEAALDHDKRRGKCTT